MTQPRVLFVGRATLDVVYSLDHFPSEDTKTFARAMHVACGGPATNAAITHALLGGKSQLMTAVGRGLWSANVRDDLQSLGVELIDLAEGTPYETPLTTVLVNKAHATRTIVNPPPPEIELRHPLRWERDWGDPPGLVLIDGFHVRETLPLLRALQAEGARICLDGGSWKSGTEELTSLLSTAICSERFVIPEATAAPDATIAWLAAKNVSQIAITRGARPIIGWECGRTFEIEIARVEAVDTTGAGDVLHGAFCFYFAQTGDFEQSLRLAAEIATRSCRGLGIRAWKKSSSV